ncbi:MAG: amino acid racemase [Luteolibacter sp.]
MKKPTKRIGLIGGLSPESTIRYYKVLCEMYNRREGGLHFPEIVMDSVNLQHLVGLFGCNAWDEVAEILLASLDRLKAAGADFAAILANTPHNAYALIRTRSPLEIYTIMDATSSALRRSGVKRIGLLGTRPTMEAGFFQKHFSNCGIESCVPGDERRQELDRIIWDELAHGQVSPAAKSLAGKLRIELEELGAEALVLGCTELNLLFDEEHSRLPLYDTLLLHAEGILAFADGEMEEG